MDIQKASKQIYKIDENVDAYRDAINNIERLHCSANS